MRRGRAIFAAMQSMNYSHGISSFSLSGLIFIGLLLRRART
jgi:hypothetical protein